MPQYCIAFQNMCFSVDLLILPVTVVTSHRNLKIAKTELNFHMNLRFIPGTCYWKFVIIHALILYWHQCIHIVSTSHILANTHTRIKNIHYHSGIFCNVQFTFIVHMLKVFYFIFILTFTWNKLLLLFLLQN